MSLLVSVFIIIENFIGMRRILCFGFLDTGSPARPERILVIHPFVALGKLILSFREFIDVFEAEGRAQVYFETTAGSFLRRNDNSAIRSEEHTSELQSRENLVCRLLLEKKKVQWTVSYS